MNVTSLADLGWRPFFEVQVDAGDKSLVPARVVAVHRGRVALAGLNVPDSAVVPRDATATVGDWVLVDAAGRVARVLQRAGAFKRRAPGKSGELQWLAANVDTVFVVTSANRDFNVARLERYLALAHDAGAWPVVVITKADTIDSAEAFVAASRRLAPGLVVEALDARDPAAVRCLTPWCETGQTVALIGSSGVGKSTLVNSLTGAVQATQAVRADDQRGRHTTASRSMHRLPAGAWLIDTPGMRELGLAGIGEALDEVFADVAACASRCRFADCSHEAEPDCGVQAAIVAGTLDPERLARYRKLKAEDRRNSESLAERRHRDRSLGRFYKTVMNESRRNKHGEY
jgi:ribosome biogenesis GTPase